MSANFRRHDLKMNGPKLTRFDHEIQSLSGGSLPHRSSAYGLFIHVPERPAFLQAIVDGRPIPGFHVGRDGNGYRAADPPDDLEH